MEKYDKISTERGFISNDFSHQIFFFFFFLCRRPDEEKWTDIRIR